MSALPIYAFSDASGVQHYVDTNDFVFSGTWSSAGTYFASPLEAAQYGQMLYMCATDNVGRNPSIQPTRFNPTRYWSAMVVVVPAQGTTSPDRTLQLATDAYNIAVTGTNLGTLAYNLAQAGSNLAWDAFTLAQTGTQAPNYSAGGTMTGSLTLPNVVLGVGSVPWAGTILYNFSGSAYQETVVTGDLAIGTTGFQNGAEITVVLIPDGNLRNISYVDSSITWLGTYPPVSISTKVTTFDLTCLNDSPFILGTSAIAINSSVAAIGNSYQFDTSQFNEFTGGAAALFPTEVTISMWIRPVVPTPPPGPPGPTPTMALVHRTSGDPEAACDFAVYMSDHLTTFAWAGSTVSLDGTTTLVDNTWYHVAMTCKQNADLSVYLNGVADASSASMGMAPLEGSDWWIGKSCLDNDGRGAQINTDFNGLMTEVAIWRKALTPSQITALVAPVRGTPLTIEAPSLILYCPMTGTPDGAAVSTDWVEQAGIPTQSRTGTPISKQVPWP